MRLRSVSALLALLTLPLVVTGCGRDQARNPMAPQLNTPQRVQPQDGADETFLWGLENYVSRAMFVHASPDAPAVDIFAGWRQVADDLAFPGNTPYRWFLAGPKTVRVNVANTSTTVIRADVNFASRTFYSVFAVNSVSSIEPLVLVDDLTPPAAGKAHVRFIHLSPNAPAVDIAVANGGPVVFPNVSFKGYTAFTPLPAGSYDLEVRLAGTNTVVLPLPGVVFEPGKIYTVFARGLVGGTGVQALGAQVIVNSEARRRAEPLSAPIANLDGR